jgi:Cdc6-like AAA superfamily ATPase
VVVASTVIDILLRVAEKNSGKILGIAADKVMKLRDSISVNFSDYFESSVERCSHVTTIFDRSKPVNLLSIYVQTKLSYSQHQMTDKQLREQIAKVSAGDSIRIFLITGSAGTGKTFLMRWLF